MPGSSFESDLKDAREARGLSLDDIQAETRIPVHILKQFEDGQLVGDPTYNEVYLRAFLKSYAKAVGLSQSDTLAGYDQSRGRSAPTPAPPPVADTDRTAPTANGSGLTVEADEPAPPAPDPVVDTSDRPTAAATTDSVPLASAATPDPKPSRPPAVTAASGSRSGAPSASTAPTTRVRRPPVPSARRSFDKNWGTIIGLFVAVVAVLGAALWLLVFRDADGPDDSPIVAEDSTGDAAAIDSVGVGAGSGSNAPQLQLPISVTLYAGGNGLQNFRVTAEPEERLGHWIEAGDSKTYTSAEAITLWGEGGDGFGDDAVVELQGQRWTPTGTSPIRIDATTGQSLLDSLAARPPGSVPALPSAPTAGAAE